jgi:hypothetical protein
VQGAQRTPPDQSLKHTPSESGLVAATIQQKRGTVHMNAAIATVVRLRVTRASHLTPTALVVVWVMLLARQNQARVSSAHNHVASAVHLHRCNCERMQSQQLLRGRIVPGDLKSAPSSSWCPAYYFHFVCCGWSMFNVFHVPMGVPTKRHIPTGGSINQSMLHL